MVQPWRAMATFVGVSSEENLEFPLLHFFKTLKGSRLESVWQRCPSSHRQNRGALHNGLSHTIGCTRGFPQIWSPLCNWGRSA